MKYGQYPPKISDNAKRNLRKRAETFRVVEDKLFYVSPVEVEAGIKRLVLYDEAEIQKILGELHVDEQGKIG